MVIVQLSGGLGNQLFQYSMGRTLSLKNNVPIKLDLSFFKNYEWHEYSLAPFAIQAEMATDQEVNDLKQAYASFSGRLMRKLGVGGNSVLYEKSLLYNPTYLDAKTPVYLIGYWQCDRYFLSNVELIRKELSVIVPPSARNKEMLDSIRSHTAVSLHIRRGNFISVSEVNKVHGTCSLEYYEQACQYISERMTDPVFYVFSDDISWAKQSLKGDYRFVFIDLNDAKTDYEDFRLMSSCRHHIIANSTFSWWASWLNSSPEKIIVAPLQWFADPEKNAEARDIIPRDWIRI